MNAGCMLVGIDPGSDKSGVCLVGGEKGLAGYYVDNAEVFELVEQLAGVGRVVVVIEDIKPYRGMRLYSGLIDTCKFIGELVWRFGCCRFVVDVKLVARNSVKKWVFDSCPDICLERIGVKIGRLNEVRKGLGEKLVLGANGGDRLPSFHWVDDRIIIACLKSILSIPTPLPGQCNIYGLGLHSYQALAVALYYLSLSGVE